MGVYVWTALIYQSLLALGVLQLLCEIASGFVWIRPSSAWKNSGILLSGHTWMMHFTCKAVRIQQPCLPVLDLNRNLWWNPWNSLNRWVYMQGLCKSRWDTRVCSPVLLYWGENSHLPVTTWTRGATTLHSCGKNAEKIAHAVTCLSQHSFVLMNTYWNLRKPPERGSAGKSWASADMHAASTGDMQSFGWLPFL